MKYQPATGTLYLADGNGNYNRSGGLGSLLNNDNSQSATPGPCSASLQGVTISGNALEVDVAIQFKLGSTFPGFTGNQEVYVNLFDTSVQTYPVPQGVISVPSWLLSSELVSTPPPERVLRSSL